MPKMTRIFAFPYISATFFLINTAGCAGTINQAGIEQRTASAVGRPAAGLTIYNQTTGTGGRIDYEVKAKDGTRYKCYMYSATGFQKFMSFGQTPDSDAICSVVGGGAVAPAPCNSLNKAAGKC